MADEAVVRIILQDGSSSSANRTTGNGDGASTTSGRSWGSWQPPAQTAQPPVPTSQSKPSKPDIYDLSEPRPAGPEPMPPPEATWKSQSKPSKPDIYDLSEDWVGKNDTYKAQPPEPSKPRPAGPEPMPPPEATWKKYEPPVNPASTKQSTPRAQAPFDPYEEARKRRESQQRSAQTDAAYKQMYGSKMDTIMEMVDRFRGTIGGVLGTFVGAVVDVVSAYRKTQRANALLHQPRMPATGAADSTTGTDAAAAGGAASSGMTTAAIVVAAAAVAAVAIGKAVVGAINKAEDKYSAYSPAIAQAQAYEEIRQVMGDMRRAQEIGPEMAKYIRARADLEQRYEDIKVKLLTKLMPIATAILKILEAGLELLSPIFDVLGEVFTAIVDILKFLHIYTDKPPEKIEDPTSVIFKDAGRGGVLVPAL